MLYSGMLAVSDYIALVIPFQSLRHMILVITNSFTEPEHFYGKLATVDSWVSIYLLTSEQAEVLVTHTATINV